METVPSNERIHGIKTGVAEESHPQVEIANITVSGVQFTARLLPQTPAPERRFLLDVFIGASQKAVTRSTGQIADIYGHAVGI
jgi:hypothetical protein